ncbi:arylamine N-acetyltransferase family protein [Ornithinimicrobium sp. Y1847]|uniref:arylamine N-acetyltransferase family protein n=1 Tax=unclassified Ornithinimicrobium TaxID=2615080 RepID=UPI003B68402C
MTLLVDYLARLGVKGPGLGLAGLRELHRAHVERVPYSTVDIVLRRPVPAEEMACVRRVVEGRGGYCFHLNGAFGWLLRSLGYAVSYHRAGVQGRSMAEPSGANGTHVALVVDLGREGRWLADVGLGSGLHSPARLVEGDVRDGALRFGLRRSDVERRGWRLDHDRRADSFVGMDLAAGSVTWAEATARHEELSTSPWSPFVRRLSVQRRDEEGVDALLATSWRRITASGMTLRTLSSPDELRQVLGDVFGLDVSRHGVSEAELDALWRSASLDQPRD